MAALFFYVLRLHRAVCFWEKVSDPNFPVFFSIGGYVYAPYSTVWHTYRTIGAYRFMEVLMEGLRGMILVEVVIHV